MKVILLEELKGRGGEGDVIEVATGYAVNYLFPRKIAVQATRGNLKQLELRKHNIAKRETERLDTAEKMLAALDGKTLRIGAKVGEEGQLFGSVTTQQVANALNERFKTEIDRKRIDLHETIKRAGEHTATITIYRDAKATVTIDVVDEKQLAATATAEADTAAEDAEAAATEGTEVVESAEAVAEAVENVVEATNSLVDDVKAVVEEAQAAIEDAVVETEAAVEDKN